ncbi:MAG: bacteriocin [Bacteroidota bacterium]
MKLNNDFKTLSSQELDQINGGESVFYWIGYAAGYVGGAFARAEEIAFAIFSQDEIPYSD